MATLNSQAFELLYESPPFCFFGYYDRSPFSASRTKVLAHRTNFDGRAIREDDQAEIGFFDISRNWEWSSLGFTRAFNWQQGAMLQWLGPDFDTRVAWNDCIDGNLVSVVANLCGGRHVHPFPITQVLPDGIRAISVNYDRHAFCRAYHYECNRKPVWNLPLPPGDGLYLRDWSLQTSTCIVETARLAAMVDAPSSTPHWLDHPILNPSGTQIAFFHRFGHGENFRTNLCSIGIEGTGLQIFNTSKQFTHTTWKDKRRIVAWGKSAGLIQSTAVRGYNRLAWLRRVVAPIWRFARERFLSVSGVTQESLWGDGYWLCDTDTGQVELLDTAGVRCDGHPTVTRNGSWLLSDSYPDKKGFQHLRLIDLERGIAHQLASFPATEQAQGSWRCDLHPRLSRDSALVCFDSAHCGERRLYVGRIQWQNLLAKDHDATSSHEGWNDSTRASIGNEMGGDHGEMRRRRG